MRETRAPTARRPTVRAVRSRPDLWSLTVPSPLTIVRTVLALLALIEPSAAVGIVLVELGADLARRELQATGPDAP